jgi:hypothetical protein
MTRSTLLNNLRKKQSRTVLPQEKTLNRREKMKKEHLLLKWQHQRKKHMQINCQKSK